MACNIPTQINESEFSESNGTTQSDKGPQKKAPLPVRDKIQSLVGIFDLFSDEFGITYLNIPCGNVHQEHRELHPLKSQVARRFLTNMFTDRYGRGPSSQGIKEGIDLLDARASRVVVKIGLRTMEYNNGFSLDLCDESWNRVVVTPGSWEMVQEGPLFRRGPQAQALPHPVSGGNPHKLRAWLNLGSEEDWNLVMGWLVFALQPKGPYPILVLQGEQSSCKSTMVKILVSLIDPSVMPIQNLPKTERDLMVLAKSRHVLPFDNLSHLNSEMKDSLCRLATGTGFSSRKLYSDSDTVGWHACRPIILAGINNLLVADDLADRAISITLPHVPKGQRKTEREFFKEFDRQKFEILGALFDAAAMALEAPAPPEKVDLPRMADFSHFAASAAFAWGSNYEEFLENYQTNRREVVERGLDSDPLAQVVRAFMKSNGVWQGSKMDLLRELQNLADTQDVLETLPKNPRKLGEALRKIIPALRATGIEITELGRSRAGYQVRIELVGPCVGVRGERCARPTLLDLEEEKKKRGKLKGIQRSQRSQSTPSDDPASAGESQ